MLPQSNARFTAIAEGGASGDWDTAETAGTITWHGNVDAYVSDQEVTEIGNGTVDIRIVTFMIVQHDPQIVFNPGDSITYAIAGVEYTRTVRNVVFSALPGMLSTIRLYFEDA
jgi:hypothetical protein